MKQYVLCFAHPLPHTSWPEVLLIEKKKPAWQAGLYNLPGGSVEEGETIHDAAIRELHEETGIESESARILGTIQGEGFVVYVCRCEFDSLRGRNRHDSLTNEFVFWMPCEEAFRHPLLIDNLRFIIPFCRSELDGWSLYQGPMHHPHQFDIQLEEQNAPAQVS